MYIYILHTYHGQPTCHCGEQLCLSNHSSLSLSSGPCETLPAWLKGREGYIGGSRSERLQRVEQLCELFEGRHLSGKETKIREVELHCSD